MKKDNDVMNKIVSLAKRRGFIYPSSEIYGGISSCWDYGPVGVELKRNLRELWWKEMVQERENVVGLDASIIMSPEVWEASGHLSSGFADPLVECKKCHKRFRKDKIEEETGEILEKCPECSGELTEEKQFNLMMKTFIGTDENKARPTYLRGETCQGIYVNYDNVRESMRLKIPFGIAQVGKAFRNEITPGNFIFRMREFEQMEMQYFIEPGKNKEVYSEWKKSRMAWHESLGLKSDVLRYHDHAEEDLAHYAKQAVDIEYKFPWGFDEVEGIHDRGDWDLSNHSKSSGKDMKYFDDKTGEKYYPNVIETSVGLDRLSLVHILNAYDEEEVRDEKRVVLRFNKKLAPFKVAVLPLSKKEELTKVAKEIYKDLAKTQMVQYDITGSIGKRYRRQDEIGTPFAVTVDFDSLEDKKVTVRDRDSMEQERIEIAALSEFIKRKMED